MVITRYYSRLTTILLIVFALSISHCAHVKNNDTGISPDETNRPSITLKWRTESEADNYGFNIFRSESPDGPFTRVNTEIVAGAGTSGSPHEYAYIDYGVERGKIYYYYLESVSLNGAKEKFSPVIQQQVPVKKEKQDA